MIRPHLLISVFSLAGLCGAPAMGGCQGEMCVDVFPNATVTGVAYDESTRRAWVSLHHSLSYCTGSDEKRYAAELLEIDLVRETVTFSHRATEDLSPYDLSDRCCAIFTGEFGNEDRCETCELVLNTLDLDYTFHFIATETMPEVMSLVISGDGSEMMRLSIGGYETTLVE